MSDFEFQNFSMPELVPDEAKGEKLFPRQDMEQDPRRAYKHSTVQENVSDEDKINATFNDVFQKPVEYQGDTFRYDEIFVSKADVKAQLEEAKKQAEEMIQDAQDQVERIEQEAYEKGYRSGKDQGYKESREEGAQKLVPCVEAFERSIREMAEARKVTYKNCEAELIELFNSLSRRVIHRELGRSNEFILDVIREAMKEITQQEKITLRLNSEDLEYAESFKPGLIMELGNVKSIHMEKDDSVIRGGCIIETNFGDIDSRVESKIREIEKILIDEKPEKKVYKTPGPGGKNEESSGR